MNEPVTIHIIDEDPGLRKSLSAVTESASLRAYASPRQFLAEANLQTPGCVVMDLRMPGTGGVDLLRQLNTDGKESPIIILTGPGDVKTAVSSLKLGAMDVLQKPVEEEELVGAIRRALEISRESHRRRGETAMIRRRMEALTLRELELLRLLVMGKSNKQIGTELGISIKTVANHRASLMAKTQALNAADLARMSTVAEGIYGRLFRLSPA